MFTVIISNRQIPDLMAFHHKLASLVPSFNGITLDDRGIVIDLSEDPTQETIDLLENAQPPVAIPKAVTPRQIRQALVISGISLNIIESAIDSLPEPTKSLAKIEWEYSTAFERNRPLVNEIAHAIGWTPAQLDNLWILAASLS